MSFPKVKAYAYYHLNPHDGVNPVLTALFQTFTLRQEELSRTVRSELKLGFYLHCSVQLQVSSAPCWGWTALLYFFGDLKLRLSCVYMYVLCLRVIYRRCMTKTVYTSQFSYVQPKHTQLISVQNFALNVLQVSHFDTLFTKTFPYGDWAGRLQLILIVKHHYRQTHAHTHPHNTAVCLTHLYKDYGFHVHNMIHDFPGKQTFLICQEKSTLKKYFDGHS